MATLLDTTAASTRKLEWDSYRAMAQEAYKPGCALSSYTADQSAEFKAVASRLSGVYVETAKIFTSGVPRYRVRVTRGSGDGAYELMDTGVVSEQSMKTKVAAFLRQLIVLDATREANKK